MQAAGTWRQRRGTFASCRHHRGAEVRIDEHLNIVIDGQSSVQIGWYDAVRLDDLFRDS